MANNVQRNEGDAATLLLQDSQRRSEALQAEALTGLSRLLLPSALAVARLAAWNEVRRLVQ